MTPRSEGRPPILVHCWLPDDIRTRLERRFRVDYHDAFADGQLGTDALCERLRGSAGVLLMGPRVGAEILDACVGTLRVIANVAVGVDNIDLAAATRNGVLVTNTPGVLDAPVADLTMALVLAVGRRLAEGDRLVRGGHFRTHPFSLLWGADIGGETLGIVGLGRIGKRVAARAQGFGMKVCYHNRNRLSADETKALDVRWRSLPELLAESRYVVLLCPLSPETRHLIAAPQLARMRREGFLINVARGPVVEEEALVQALQEGEIAGAALDVYEFEPKVHPALREMENVVLTPHIASATRTTRLAMIDLAARNLEAALTGETVPTPVNPEVRAGNR